MTATGESPSFAQDAREIALIEKLGVTDHARSSTPGQQSASAQAKSDEALLTAARQIDQYLAADWDEHKIRPNPRADDQTFVRRAYLDIVGRIPSLKETVTFLKSRDPDRRLKLIDELLQSEGYVHHQFNFWANLLRIKSDLNNNTPGEPYVEWIKTALRENQPYDQMVRDLITAEGLIVDNGAAGFYLHDNDMALDHMANTIQVFLGTRLVCAQCHDHPFDKWSQYEFYELAAYTYGVRARGYGDPPNVASAKKMVRSKYGKAEDGREVMRELNDLARPLQYAVNRTDRKIRLPNTYQYDDAKPGDMVAPMTIFRPHAETLDGRDPVQVYADWMTRPENPRFTRVIANRMWKRVFGRGLVEPVDDFSDGTEATNEKLLAFLEHQMIRLGYDLRAFQKMLMATQAYQREVTIDDVPVDEAYYFPGPLLRRMTAEQWWDSMMTLMIPEVDERAYDSRRSQQRIAQIQYLKQAEPQTLVMMAERQWDYEKARREGKDAKRPNMMDMMSMSGEGMQARDDARWDGYRRDYVRAAELRSPAGPGHFLGVFGQSDRDQIDNFTNEANSIQVLMMFNGSLVREIGGDKSHLMKNVQSFGSENDQITAAFLSILSRKPTTGELKLTRALLDEDRRYGWSRVVWGLLNTRQFSFIQ